MRLYRLLTGADDAAFCHKVSAALDAGWELHGGPVMAFDAEAGTMRCGQAVTKEAAGRYSAEMKLGEA